MKEKEDEEGHNTMPFHIIECPSQTIVMTHYTDAMYQRDLAYSQCKITHSTNKIIYENYKKTEI